MGCYPWVEISLHHGYKQIELELDCMVFFLAFFLINAARGTTKLLPHGLYSRKCCSFSVVIMRFLFEKATFICTDWLSSAFQKNG